MAMGYGNSDFSTKTGCQDHLMLEIRSAKSAAGAPDYWRRVLDAAPDQHIEATASIMASLATIAAEQQRIVDTLLRMCAAYD
jgi:hypothetical protein